MSAARSSGTATALLFRDVSSKTATYVGHFVAGKMQCNMFQHLSTSATGCTRPASHIFGEIATSYRRKSTAGRVLGLQTYRKWHREVDMKHTLIIIGLVGSKMAYLDISMEEALQRYGPQNGETIKTLHFDDQFWVWDAEEDTDRFTHYSLTTPH